MRAADRRLWLGGHRRSRHQLCLTFGVDELVFNTSYWYGDVDLKALEQRFGLEVMERIYFHIAAFEANKLTSLRPRRFDPGPWERFVDSAFVELWSTIQRQVWAQWRYEHDDPDYLGPELASLAPAAGRPLRRSAGPVATLAFCGGGKDSLVALRLLERAEVPFDSFAYSSSVYGLAAVQHRLIDGMLLQTAARQRRRLWIYDDFIDSPVAELHGELGVRSLTAAETPSSLFAALPLVLEHGYRRLVLAHERSADHGNLIWQRTGEEVNHQWGKSLAAETLLADYLAAELIEGVEYFSLLKPIWDVLIFQLLAADAERFKVTHSCNVAKPWCRRCPKCAYVWLCAMAYLPRSVVDSVFAENLFAVTENRLHFRRMLGLEKHTPFECIGTIDEARLAFELCRRKGLKGGAMDDFCQQVEKFEVGAALERFLAIDVERSRVPSDLRQPLRLLFEGAAVEARQRIMVE